MRHLQHLQTSKTALLNDGYALCDTKSKKSFSRKFYFLKTKNQLRKSLKIDFIIYCF